MDDFKKYMQHHSNEMDFDEPGEAVWKNIAEKTKKREQGIRVPMFIRLTAAACFIVIAVSVGILLNRNEKPLAKIDVQEPKKISVPVREHLKAPESIEQKPEELLVKQGFKKSPATTLIAKKTVSKKGAQPDALRSTTHGAPMLQNIENSFGQLVSMQLNKVRSLPLYAEGPEYYSEFKKQFQQLEEDEKELKKLIRKDGLINENLDKIINVYQQKLNLLKLLQNEINKTNSQYRQNNHSDTTSAINYINL